MPCLYCEKPMFDTVPRLHGMAACGHCGMLYSAELLEAADPSEWARALAGDGYRIERYSGPPPSVSVHRLAS